MVKIHSKKKKNKLKQAFTLVELIIVIAVIAVLAIFLIPNFSSVISDTNATQVKNDTSNIRNIVMSYISETGAVPVANSNTEASKKTISITADGKPYKPGVSVAEFTNEAEKTPDEFWIIDMDLLTKKQINIDDKISTVTPKLTSIPATSAIVDAVDGTNTVTTNKKIKNTSVCYVIDSNLDVYAAYHKEIKSNKTTALPSSEFHILKDGDGAKQHNIFKQAYVTGTVNATIDVDDSNYN